MFIYLHKNVVAFLRKRVFQLSDSCFLTGLRGINIHMASSNAQFLVFYWISVDDYIET